MIECPEATILAYQIEQEFIGKTLKKIMIKSGKFLKLPIRNLHSLSLPTKLTEVLSKGKRLIFKFNGDIYFILILGSTGTLSLKNNVFTRIIFDFIDKKLFLNDVKESGTLFNIILNKREYENYINEIASPFLSKGFGQISKNEFINFLNLYPNLTITELLLSQKYICSGIGLCTLSEILNESKLTPYIKSKEISTKEKLYSDIKNYIQYCFDNNGIPTFKNLYDKQGRVQLKVFKQKDAKEIIGPQGKKIWIL